MGPCSPYSSEAPARLCGIGGCQLQGRSKRFLRRLPAVRTPSWNVLPSARSLQRRGLSSTLRAAGHRTHASHQETIRAVSEPC